ncbi:AraC family transcriptional regulator [Vibrio sp. 10N.286.49.B3]|uniref:AraC family transcriptional regulator n=1 Tax=Vibrio sp. 10N.286.49.B3 TaxID=1880855 RepID=UPI000C84AB44|nr:AraC family transcriptional regulator [Vibrio sp. 10N.286.49.B3]PMH43185.1 AraC family transcriptional regulator [Vibrio sp. 10N.286.49.B3]
MNYAIEYQNINFPFIAITPRKKVLKHSLISVQQGLILARLGKKEYTIEPGQSLWIPFDCLVSMTYFPNTQVHQVEFSARISDPLPLKAGHVTLSVLTQAIINKLSLQVTDETHLKDLLAVLKVEMTALKPQLKESHLGQQLNAWYPECEHNLDQSQHLVMMLREAKKRLLSGSKKQLVIDELFSGRNEEFDQLCLLAFGELI